MSGRQGRPRRDYEQHQAEHAAELARIRAAAEGARLSRAAAAYARAEGPPVYRVPRRRADVRAAGEAGTAAKPAVHAARRNATYAASAE